MNIAILGGGISGLSLFDILDSKYNIKSDIYEKESNFGGLCRTIIKNDYVYDLSGGHVFNSKYKDVLDYVFNLLPKDKWEFSERKSKINFNENIIDYPFEFSLSKIDVHIAADCIESLFERLKNLKVNNFRDALIKNFGQSIYDYYLGPYNEKIWKYPISDMDYDWLEGKLPFPNSREILIKTLSKSSKEQGMSHSSYYYPKVNGIQMMIDAISRNITKTSINNPVLDIEVKGKITYVNNKPYDLVINTIPLPEIANIFQNLDENILKTINNLKFISVQSFLFSIDKENDWSWLYIPNKNIIPHRIVYQGNFASNNAPAGKSSVTVEITKPQNFSRKEMLENIKNNLGLSNPISDNFTKYAYVLFDKKRTRNMNKITEYFKSRNIILHGRFAEWTYPNMDICIKKSLDLAQQIFKNII